MSKMNVLLLGANHSSTLNSLSIGLKRIGVSVYAFDFAIEKNGFVNESHIQKVFQDGYSRIKMLYGVWQLFKLIRKVQVIHIYSSFYIPSAKVDYLFKKIFFRRKGIKYFITYTGSDIRDPIIELSTNKYFEKAYSNPNYEGKDYETSHGSKERQSYFARNGFHVIANPETDIFINRELFKSVYHYHHPSINEGELGQYKIENRDENSPVRFLHAPTSSIAKGSVFVIDAIEKLKLKWGELVEFEIIQNKSNQEYLNSLSNSDVLLDQFIWGWYGVATQQALELGKIVVCYLHTDRMRYVENCPIINANIDNLFEVLDQLMLDRIQIPSYSKAGREFYHRYHNPEAVATKVNSFYSI